MQFDFAVKVMNIYILTLFLLFLVGCSTSDSSKIVAVDSKTPIANEAANEKTAVENTQSEKLPVGNEDSKALDCSDPNGYQIETDRDSEFDLVNIVQGNQIAKTLKMPNDLSVNGFGLNWAKKTKRGFEISIVYGSRYYYEKEFNFECKERQFYLNKIRVNTFDKNDPENSGKNYTTNIKPNVPLTKFTVTDYMGELGKYGE